MIGIFIAAVIVMAVMIYFMVVMIRIVVGTANRSVNFYFLKKLDDFDEDFRVRTKQIEKLIAQREELEDQVKSVEDQVISITNSRFYAPRPQLRSIYIPVARYIDNNFFEDYKMAKNLLAMDKEQIIRNIMAKFPYEGDREAYDTACEILKMLDLNAIYGLSSLQRDEQFEILKEVFDRDQKKMLCDYIETLVSEDDFDILGFLTYVKEVRTANNIMVIVRLGDTKEDYSYIADNVVCERDDNISEGLRVVYQNKVYDYSMYKSRKKNDK